MVNAAVGKTSGTVKIYGSENSASVNVKDIGREVYSNAAGVDVDMVSVSDFAREKNIEYIEFIKIDTEGHDVAVLEGMEGILKAHKVWVTVHRRDEFELLVVHCN